MISGACLGHPQNKTNKQTKKTIISFKETKREMSDKTIREYHNHCLVVYEAWDISHSVNEALGYSLSLSHSLSHSDFFFSIFAQNIQRAEILRQIYMKIKFYKHTPGDNVKINDGQTSKNMYIQKKRKALRYKFLFKLQHISKGLTLGLNERMDTRKQGQENIYNLKARCHQECILFFC